MSKTMKSSVGYSIHNNENIALSVRDSLDQGFNYVVTPLSHPVKRVFCPVSDVFLDFNERSLLIVLIHRRDYKLSANVNLLKKELNYASHFGVTNVIIEAPFDEQSQTILIGVVGEFLKKHSVIVYLKISLVCEKSNSTYRSYRKNNAEFDENDYDSPWKVWNSFRMALKNHSNFKIALELNADLPDEERIERWLGEVIGIVILKTSIFQSNSSKFPVLSRSYQDFIQRLIFKTASSVSFTIKGNNMHQALSSYVEYIKHLHTQDALQQTVSEGCKGFEDVLQIPLQPLKDNLESSFYEIFESDFIKYRQYYLATLKAFNDFSGDEIVAMVLGAGRGPLVEKTLDAARDANKKVLLYALDKNENAIVTLESLRQLRWGGDEGLPHGRVDIINEDMRFWNAPHKADFIISELLGSFGDNELSPECLDGVWRYVHEKTVSIPCEYTSFLAPVQSQKLYSQMRYEVKVDSPDNFGYVVHVRNAYLIDEPQAVFKFEHRNLLLKPEQRDNNRTKMLTFESKLATACHGFVGYFNCRLYDDVIISIEPSTANANMFSWFPIYFPIETPFTLDSNETIQLEIQRLVDSEKVWYEWRVHRPTETKIHNHNGTVYAIGLRLDEPSDDTNRSE